MPIITSKAGVITQINVFTVPQGGQQPMIDLLREAALFARETPGWLSASLHRSVDGTRVANYAQCADMAASELVIRRLAEAGYLERNKALGVAAPGLYEVAWTLER